MTDFVRRVLRPEHPDWIIRSLLDVDFYKFTMGYFIWWLHRGVIVKFSLINRHVRIPLAKIIDRAELCRQLDHVRTLRFTRTDLAWLRGQDYYGANLFPDEYLAFLSELRMPPYTLRREGDQYVLAFEGPWEVVTFWETIALAIISELFFRALMQSMSEMELEALFGKAKAKLFAKLKALAAHEGIFIADFGQRRRFSFLWQRFAIAMAREVLGVHFTGSSNAWMAFNQDLPAIGTNAHELPMVLTALAPDDEKRLAQYDVLREWEELFPRGGLRIALPDTYGTRQFFERMPENLAERVAREWRGIRLDSGDPVEEAIQYMGWLERFGVKPMRDGKIVIPSDGLDVDSMTRIDTMLGNSIAHPFGWGTKLTNDFEDCHPRHAEEAVVHGERLGLTWSEVFRGHSIVCKVAEANGKPAVKLSNNVNKATGPKDEVEKYLRIFGHKGRMLQTVEV